MRGERWLLDNTNQLILLILYLLFDSRNHYLFVVLNDAHEYVLLDENISFISIFLGLANYLCCLLTQYANGYCDLY